jgi:hypothetical protein
MAILNQNFADFEMEEAEIAETASGKSYEFELEVGEEEFEVIIDTQGKLNKSKNSKNSKENE